MTDYWVSQARKYCDFCKCWITDNKPSVQFHESGKKHKQNVQYRLKEIGKKSLQDHKVQTKLDADMKKMEKEAVKAYLKDIEANPDYTSQLILQRKEENIKEQQKARLEKIGELSAVNLTSNDGKINTETGRSFDNKLLWYQAKSDEGYTYYWHVETGESRWEVPEEGFVSLQKQQKLAKSQTNTNSNVSNGDTDRKPKSKSKKKTNKVIDTSDNAAAPEEGGSMSYGPAEKPDPYGSWTEVEKKTLDLSELGLPRTEYVDLKVPSLQPESQPKIEFEEKTVSSFCGVNGLNDECSNTDNFQFKRRKITKSNMRQRSDD